MSFQRLYDVYTSIDVETTSCAYWDVIKIEKFDCLQTKTNLSKGYL